MTGVIVQRVEGFVEQRHAGAHCQRPPQCQALRFTPAEARRLAIEKMGELEHLGQLGNSGGDRRPAPATHHQGEGPVVANRPSREQRHVLGHVTHAPSSRSQMGDVAVHQPDRPCHHRPQTADRLQERRLAAPRLAHQHAVLAGGNLERDVAQKERSLADGDVGKRDHGSLSLVAQIRPVPRTEDRENLVAEHPLLPVRRRFREQVLRAVDLFGTAAQLRTQLRIVYEAARSTGDSPVGTVIPGDFIYEQIAQDLLQSAVLLREIHENADTLKRMADAGKLVQIGDEYRMQTKQSSAWEGDFQERRSRLLQNDQQMASLRADKLREKCDASLQGVKLLHGKSKVSRKIEFHYGSEPPKATGMSVPVWIRDGWSDSLKSVEDEARQFGTNSRVVFAFIERRASDDLKHALAEWKAAVDTLEIRGEPTSPGGREARRAMETRKNIAEGRLELLLSDVFKDARVFQGGGTEFESGTLSEKVQAAAMASLARISHHPAALPRARAWRTG